MYETLGSNIFLMQADPERRLAHRREIKRALAEIEVKKCRIVELRSIIQKLGDASDRAADEHGTAAGRLQGELDELDRQHIESILEDTSSPPEAIQRRRQILDELTELNRTLETTCEANKRAAKPLERQIHTLIMASTSEGALRNQLVSLCSVAMRRKMKLCELKLQLASAGAKEAQRLASTIEHNKKICGLNHDCTGATIQSIKLSDAESLVSAMQAEIGELHEEAARLQAAVLAE